MSKIHRSAIIEAGAKIDENVEIGPYAVVGSRVQIYPGNRLDAHVCVKGTTTLGRNNHLHCYTYLGGPPQHLDYDEKVHGKHSSLVIGEGNVFREFSQVHCSLVEHSQTKIGDHNFLMTQCHVGHDATVGDHNILVQGCMVGGHCEIGDHVNLAGFTGVHQRVRVGSYSMLGAMSVATKDIPPYVMAQGQRAEVFALNAIGLRRAGFTVSERSLIKKMFQIYYIQDRSHRQGLERLQTEFSVEMKREAPESLEPENRQKPENRQATQEERNLQIVRRFIEFLATAGDRGVTPSRRQSKANRDSRDMNDLSRSS